MEEDESESRAPPGEFRIDDPKEKAVAKLGKELESFGDALAVSRENIENFKNQSRKISDERLLVLNMRILAAAFIYTYKAKITPDKENFPIEVDKIVLEQLAQTVKSGIKNPPKDTSYDTVKIKANIIAYINLILLLL